jgi:hypothetical protein
MSDIEPEVLMPDDPSAAHLSLWERGLGRVPDCVWQKTGLFEGFDQIGALKRIESAPPFAARFNGRPRSHLARRLPIVVREL